MLTGLVVDRTSHRTSRCSPENYNKRALTKDQRSLGFISLILEAVTGTVNAVQTASLSTTYNYFSARLINFTQLVNRKNKETIRSNMFVFIAISFSIFFRVHEIEVI